MKRVLWLTLLLLWLVGAAPAVADLGQLLAWQKRGDSGAFVSSGFHDWRGISKYRSRPGLHAGYDIAMLAGSAVRTPWPGTVVAITPWYGQEVGVTVRLENGWEATFGHITPSVAVGQQVRSGDLMGRVVVDHVDVKVRDGGGGFIDFAVRKIRSSGHLVATPPLPPLAPRYSEKEKKAAEKAFADYSQALTELAQEEARVGSGLLAPKTLSQRRQRLEVLRPLALLHAEMTGRNLPKKPIAPKIGSEAGRPITDTLVLPLGGEALP